MPTNDNPPARGDHLAEMLSRGEAPSLDELLALCPDEPLSAAEPYEHTLPDREGLIKTKCGTYVIVQHEWTKRQLELRRRYPGLQLDYHFREARKYNSPYGEPLSGWVRELLNTAKMHWSRAVETFAAGWAKRTGQCVHATNSQFKDWLPGYMDEDGGWTGGERCGEAGQIVRIACGLPRFAPTKPARKGR
jgi:hypothetical protein